MCEFDCVGCEFVSGKYFVDYFQCVGFVGVYVVVGEQQFFGFVWFEFLLMFEVFDFVYVQLGVDYIGEYGVFVGDDQIVVLGQY